MTARKLDFFKGWAAAGEGHVTTITPVEFYQVLRAKLTMNDIDAIAERYRIQNSDLQVLGVGSGRVLIEGKQEDSSSRLSGICSPWG
jgi:hypothetical protein